MDNRKCLNQDERDTLTTTLNNAMASSPRDAVMLLTALNTGARATELLNIEWKDIDLDTGEIYLATLKGGRPRTVVIPKALCASIRALKDSSPIKPFNISYPRLAAIWSLYRPSPKPFRCMRHSFAMKAYEYTKDIRFVQSAMGHRSITNTMVYAEFHHSSQQFKKLMRVK